MFVDENLLLIRFYYQSESIEALQLTHETITGRQLDRHRRVRFQGLK